MVTAYFGYIKEEWGCGASEKLKENTNTKIRNNN